MWPFNQDKAAALSAAAEEGRLNGQRAERELLKERMTAFRKMKAWSKDATCPKCGCEMTTTKWCSGKENSTFFGQPYEFMLMNCSRCKAHWGLRSLDAEKYVGLDDGSDWKAKFGEEMPKA